MPGSSLPPHAYPFMDFSRKRTMSRFSGFLNCTSVISVPSPTHSSAQMMWLSRRGCRHGWQPLVDMLVPLHFLYGDGVERVAAESLLERQRWVNYLWSDINVVALFPIANRFLCKLKGCYSPSDDRSLLNAVTDALHHRVHKNDTVLQ
jgi:hypothetical protein